MPRHCPPIPLTRRLTRKLRNTGLGQWRGKVSGAHVSLRAEQRRPVSRDGSGRERRRRYGRVGHIAQGEKSRRKGPRILKKFFWDRELTGFRPEKAARLLLSLENIKKGRMARYPQNEESDRGHAPDSQRAGRGRPPIRILGPIGGRQQKTPRVAGPSRRSQQWRWVPKR